MDNFNFSQTEATGLQTTVASVFYPTDITDSPINSTTMTLTSVVDGAGVNRTGEWALVALGVVGGRNLYDLRTASTSVGYQYYGPGANTNESYTFTFAVTDNTNPAAPITNNVTTTGQLVNISPAIGDGTTQSITVISGTTGVISTQTAVNGSNISGGYSTANLTWAKVTGASNFTINSTTGQISNSSATASGNYTVEISVTDAGGASQNAILTITIGNAPVPSRFIIPEVTTTDGGMYTYYFTNPNNTSGSFQDLDAANHIIGSGFRQSTSGTPTSSVPSQQGWLCSPNKYLWRKQYKGDWFEGGNDAAFYVAIKTQNTSSFGTSATAASVEWRNLPSGLNDWQQAYDINGQKLSLVWKCLVSMHCQAKQRSSE